MNSVLNTMLQKYSPETNADRENAVKEIMQEITLSALSHAGFFDKAAFYGGTCLRIFHGLNRFSEDLDFASIDKDPNFKLEQYYPALKKEFSSYGLNISIEEKKKQSETDVKSAFLKGNTLMLFMTFFPNNPDSTQVVSNQRIKVKFEVDVDNPVGGITEFRYKTLPSPYEVRVFDESTLFAGKIHAIICREYKHRVKGRDYYDYLFYVGKGTRINLAYLENKLKNTGKIREDAVLSIEMVKDMLGERFKTVDYESAKEDMAGFISDIYSLRYWKKELFISTLAELKGN